MATETAYPTTEQTATISVRVPAELARRFNEAHEQERLKWEMLVRFQLEALAIPGRRRSIEEVMAELASQAKANGLTEEELRDILESPDDEPGR